MCNVAETTIESIYFIALKKNTVLILVSTTKPHEFQQFNITATNKLEYFHIYNSLIEMGKLIHC